MLLTQSGRPVLIAKSTDDCCDVEYLRTDLYRSMVTPITAAESRRRPARCDEGWAEHFRRQLADSADGPLRDGGWAIGRAEVAVPASRWAGEGQDGFGPGSALTDVDGELDWFGMQVHLLPLRAMPEPNDARVRAHRKLAREGLLPPVLTWRVTGLQSFIVLDGLSRLAAAWAERTPAVVLTLVEVDSPRVDNAVERATASYETAALGVHNLTGERADRAHTFLGRPLADALDAARADGITRAWPLPSGVAQWQAHRRHTPMAHRRLQCRSPLGPTSGKRRPMSRPEGHSSGLGSVRDFS
jgi:hypothetical protein